MKIEELMIGDWYWWEAEGKKYPMQVTRDTFTLADDDIANFEPISLTPEILEKNGFVIDPNIVKYGSDYDFYSFDDNITISRHFYVKDSDEWVVYVNSEEGYEAAYINDILYVHELQHILKVFGSEKEITL